MQLEEREPADVEHLWTVPCRSVRPAEHGLLSLDGLLDMVAARGLLPERALVSFECCVVSQWRRNRGEGTEFRQRLMLQYEDDTTKRVLVAGPDRVVLLDRHLFMVINKMDLLPLRGYGQYRFVVERESGDEWLVVPPTAGLWVASPEMLGSAAPPTGSS